MKLEVGMYVRTKKGKIYKFESDNSMAKNGAKKYMVNCSYNIIDILEVGDYVNGYKVIDIVKGFKVIVDKLEVDTTTGLYHNIGITNLDSIVTKEQFESIKYSLEG